MRDEWRERATVQDRCKSHTHGTDLVLDLTDRNRHIRLQRVQTNKRKIHCSQMDCNRKAVYTSLDIETGRENCGIT